MYVPTLVAVVLFKDELSVVIQYNNTTAYDSAVVSRNL